MLSIVIPTCKTTIRTLESLKDCPVPYQLIVTNVRGVAKARHAGALKAKYPLIAMFDDDLTIMPPVWKAILGLKQDEFLLTHVGEHLSSRVFAIHKSDYLSVGGFDTSIKYTFEDGDFAIRAQRAGLKLKILPPQLLIHNEHLHRGASGPFGMNLGFWNEYARLYVKYKRQFESNLLAPFTSVPHDYKIAFQWLVVRSTLILGYIGLSGFRR